MTLDARLLQSLFIAGTDTGVGKTWVATRLLAAWVSAGYRAADVGPVRVRDRRGAEGAHAAGGAAAPTAWRGVCPSPRSVTAYAQSAQTMSAAVGCRSVWSGQAGLSQRRQRRTDGCLQA